jgi:hypothetical protein
VSTHSTLAVPSCVCEGILSVRRHPRVRLLRVGRVRVCGDGVSSKQPFGDYMRLCPHTRAGTLAHTHAQILAQINKLPRARNHTHNRAHARTHARSRTQTSTHARARAHTHTSARMRTHARTHARTHTHTDVCTHNHTHAHARTGMRRWRRTGGRSQGGTLWSSAANPHGTPSASTASIRVHRVALLPSAC